MLALGLLMCLGAIVQALRCDSEAVAPADPAF
jgi:hypothetical protein